MAVTTFLSNAVIYIVAIVILVTVHEYGHFWAARRIGVKVLRFSIGWGPVFWRRNLKDGTEFALSAIPIGGYVSMLGERDDNVPTEDAHRALSSQPPIKRIFVMAAGPVANFLFAILAYWVLFMSGIPGLKPVIGEVTTNSIAAQAGLSSNDVVLAVNGTDTPTREAVVIATLKDLLDDGIVNLRVANGSASPREIHLNAAGRTRELTEPDALLSGLGFDFWYPPIPAKIGQVLPGGAAEKAGLRVDDEIVRFGGAPAVDFRNLRKLIEAQPNRKVVVEVRRGDDQLTVTVAVAAETLNGRSVGRMGFGPAQTSQPMPDEMLLPRDSILGALRRAVQQTAEKTVFVFQAIGYLVVGKVSLQSVSGPIGIATVAGEVARIGLLPFISLLALISISIGALNLLPIPILDGGQIVFQLVELLKGGPVSQRTQEIALQVGIALLLLLTALAFYNDIARLT